MEEDFYMVKDQIMLVKSDGELLALLEKGLQRLRTPGVWCRQDYFRDRNGKNVFQEEQACFFCMLGACGYPAVNQPDGLVKNRAYRMEIWSVLVLAITKITGKRCLPSNYNDDEERKLSEVILVVETAIQMVKNGEYHVPVL